jgi:hypothetical protein
MVFGDRLSLDLKFENGGLGDIPQDQYFQTGGAIGIARDREPPPLPKTTQTPSQKAPSGAETKPSKTPATVKEASPTSAHNPRTMPLLVFKYTVPTEVVTPLALWRIHLHL